MEKINRVHVIACGVLAIDLKDLVASLGFDVSLSFLPGGQGNEIFPVGHAAPVGIFQSNLQPGRRLRSRRIANSPSPHCRW